MWVLKEFLVQKKNFSLKKNLGPKKILVLKKNFSPEKKCCLKFFKIFAWKKIVVHKKSQHTKSQPPTMPRRALKVVW